MARTDGLGVYAEGDVYVGCNPHIQVAGVIADVGVGIDKDVRAAVEVGEVGEEQSHDLVNLTALFHVVGRYFLFEGVNSRLA